MDKIEKQNDLIFKKLNIQEKQNSRTSCESETCNSIPKKKEIG